MVHYKIAAPFKLWRADFGVKFVVEIIYRWIIVHNLIFGAGKSAVSDFGIINLQPMHFFVAEKVKHQRTVARSSQNDNLLFSYTIKDKCFKTPNNGYERDKRHEFLG